MHERRGRLPPRPPPPGPPRPARAGTRLAARLRYCPTLAAPVSLRLTTAGPCLVGRNRGGRRLGGCGRTFAVRRDCGRGRLGRSGRVGIPGLGAIVPVAILVLRLGAIIPITISVFLEDDVPTTVLGLPVRQRRLFLRDGGGVGIGGLRRLREQQRWQRQGGRDSKNLAKHGCPPFTWLGE